MQSKYTDSEIERIVRTYSKVLLHIASSRLRNTSDAEDTVQDVFMKLITKNIGFSGSEHEKAWLIRATVNRANDLRRKSCYTSLPIDDASDIATDEPQDLIELIRALPDKYAMVIHLYYYEGYDIREIAAILNLPQATVGTRLSRARKLLKNELEENTDEINKVCKAN